MCDSMIDVGMDLCMWHMLCYLLFFVFRKYCMMRAAQNFTRIKFYIIFINLCYKQKPIIKLNK